MTHLGERITDYFFAELSPTEMDEARRHLATCEPCRTEVQQFERTHSLLRSSSDVEPPRHIVFEAEKRPTFSWKWLAPMAVAAALVLAVLVAAPMQVQWNASQLTINFGKAPLPAPAPAVQATVVSTPAPQPVVQPVDYDRIIKAVQAQLAVDLKNRDLQQVKMNQRTQDYLGYLKSLQDTTEVKYLQTADEIRMIAQKTGS